MCKHWILGHNAKHAVDRSARRPGFHVVASRDPRSPFAGAVAFILLTGALACNGEGSTSSTTESSASSGTQAATTEDQTTTTTDGASSASSTTQMPETTTEGPGNAPVIEELFVDQASLSEGETIKFTAVVLDADGLEDIAGGLLRTLEGDNVYGAFTQVSGGTFEYATSWDELHSAIPIEFTEDTSRTFVAEFTDNGGLKGSATIEVLLTCDGFGACDGVCTDLSDDPNNCQGCGVSCGPDETCRPSGCVAPSWSPCFYPTEMDCSTACNMLELECRMDACNGSTYQMFTSIFDCNAQQGGYDPGGSCDVAPEDCAFICEDMPAVRCCCG